MSTERETPETEDRIMNENERRCPTNDAVKTFTEAMYLLAMLAALVLSAVHF